MDPGCVCAYVFVCMCVCVSVCVCESESLSVVSDFCDPFSRPESWSGELFPSPVDLPDPGIKPGSPSLWVDSLPAEDSLPLQGKPVCVCVCLYMPMCVCVCVCVCVGKSNHSLTQSEIWGPVFLSSHLFCGGKKET